MDLYSHFIEFYCWCYYKFRITSCTLLFRSDGDSFRRSVRVLVTGFTFALQIPKLCFYVLATRMVLIANIYHCGIYIRKLQISHRCPRFAASLRFHSLCTKYVDFTFFFLFYWLLDLVLFVVIQYLCCCHFYSAVLIVSKFDFTFGSVLFLFFFFVIYGCNFYSSSFQFFAIILLLWIELIVSNKNTKLILVINLLHFFPWEKKIYFPLKTPGLVVCRGNVGQLPSANKPTKLFCINYPMRKKT